MTESSSTMECDACPGGNDYDVDGCGGGRWTVEVETEVESETADVVEEAEASVDASVGVAALPAEAYNCSLSWRCNKVILTVYHVDISYDWSPSAS